MRESPLIVVVAALAGMAMVAEAARSKDRNTKEVCYNAVECPDGWMEMAGLGCVKALTKIANFEDSQAACRELHDGANLVLPRNAAEHQTLLSVIQGLGTTWIGAVRAEHGKPSFVDVKGGVLMWENWNSGQPNNQGGSEDCVEVQTTRIWNDVPCSVKRNTVCQMTKATGLTLTATPSTVTPPLTPQLVVSCLVPQPRATDALRYLDSITVTLEGHDVAAVSVHFLAKLLTSQPGWAVKGSLTASPGQLGHLSVSVPSPGRGQAGRYACQALGVDDTGRPVVVQGSTDVAVKALPSACISLPMSKLRKAACDVDRTGSPWVVIQRRTVGDVRFDRSWAEYRRGFGDVTADYWLGLDAIHNLCPRTRPCQARFEFTYPGQPYDSSVPRQPSGRYVAQYGQFSVGGPGDNYKLGIGQYNNTASTAPDNMIGIYTLNGMAFSTEDADHDYWGNNNCASQHGGGGGWWYRACHHANLNGALGARGWSGLIWYDVTKPVSATSSRIMVRVAD